MKSEGDGELGLCRGAQLAIREAHMVLARADRRTFLELGASAG